MQLHGSARPSESAALSDSCDPSPRERGPKRLAPLPHRRLGSYVNIAAALGASQREAKAAVPFVSADDVPAGSWKEH